MNAVPVFVLGGVVVGLAVGAGCSLAGSWRIVDISPAGAPFPISQVTFDSAGRYAAKGLYTAGGEYDGGVHSTSGSFKRAGDRLSLASGDNPALPYRIRRRLDGRLAMTIEIPGENKKITAIFERIGGRSSP